LLHITNVWICILENNPNGYLGIINKDGIKMEWEITVIKMLSMVEQTKKDLKIEWLDSHA
jgi:hypothetical protein